MVKIKLKKPIILEPVDVDKMSRRNKYCVLFCKARKVNVTDVGLTPLFLYYLKHGK